MSRHGPHFGETTQCIGLVVVMSGLADDSQGLLQQDMHPVIFAAAGVDVALAVEIVDVFARSRVWREALIFLDADLGQGQFMDLSIGFGGIRQRNGGSSNLRWRVPLLPRAGTRRRRPMRGFPRQLDQEIPSAP